MHPGFLLFSITVTHRPGEMLLMLSITDHGSAAACPYTHGVPCTGRSVRVHKNRVCSEVHPHPSIATLP